MSVSINGLNLFGPTKYIVSTSPATGSYTSIQQAVLDAYAEGGGVVYVKYGTYTENILLVPDVFIQGVPDEGRSGTGVIIIGSLSYGSTGSTFISGITFNYSGGGAQFLIDASVNPNAHLYAKNCSFDNSSGPVFQLQGNNSANVFIEDCVLHTAFQGVSLLGNSHARIFGSKITSTAQQCVRLDNTSTAQLLYSEFLGTTGGVTMEISTVSGSSIGCYYGNATTAIAGPCINFVSQGTWTSLGDVFNSTTGLGNYVAGGGGGTYKFANSIAIGSATGIAAPITKVQLDWKPFATTTSVGTASFNSTDFNVSTAGEVSLASPVGASYSLTPYICGETGDANAQFTGATAVADAVAQVISDGETKATIYIKPGSYGSLATITTPANVQISFYGMGNPSKTFNGGFNNPCDVSLSDTVICHGNCFFQNMNLSGSIFGDAANVMVTFDGCGLAGNTVTNTDTGVFFDFFNCNMSGTLIGDGTALGTVTMSARFVSCFINGTIQTNSAGPANTGDYFEIYDCFFSNSGTIVNASTGASSSSNPSLICQGCTVASNVWLNENSANTWFNAQVSYVDFLFNANTCIAVSSGPVSYSSRPWTNITCTATTFISDTSTGSVFGFDGCSIRTSNVFTGDNSLVRVLNSVFIAGVTVGNNGQLVTENCITTGTTFVGGTAIQWDDFAMIPAVSGTPTVTPIVSPSGQQPMVYDTASDTAYVYSSGAWHPLGGSGGGVTWTTTSSNVTNMVAGTGYYCIASGGALTLGLPVTSTLGDTIRVSLIGATSWQITQASGQQIFYGNASTTLGATGTLTSTLQGDSIELVSVATDVWVAQSFVGNLTPA